MNSTFQNICLVLAVIGMIVAVYCAFSANRDIKKIMKIRQLMKEQNDIITSRQTR